jgi:hypothetical protein
MAKHVHDEEKEGMFGHHTCECNLEKSFYNLLLLTDHYTGANVNCSNCIVKHISDVIAYTEEGLALDNALKHKKLSDEIIDMMRNHLKIVLGCTTGNMCKIKNPEDLMRMVKEARALRRKIGIELYGLDTDVATDGDHSFLRKHKHEHTKALRDDIGDDTVDDINEHLETEDEHIHLTQVT